MQALLFLLTFFIINISQGYCQEAASSFEVDPHAIVAGHVDATSGAWKEEEKDLFVSSRMPFTLSRFYSSEWGEWKFFPHCTLIRGSASTSGLVISTFENNGTPLRFVQPEKNKPFHCSFLDHFTFCNTPHGPISQRTNYTHFKCEASESRILVTHPDGTIRAYERASQTDLGTLCESYSRLQDEEPLNNVSYFRLISETFPTKVTIQYCYDDVGRLSSLELVHDPKQHGREISFSYEKNCIHVAVDGRKMVSYSFLDGNLVHVDRMQKPVVRYTYQKTLLIRKDYPQGRFSEIAYDCNDRVSALFGPLSKEPLYTFHYSEGMTEVRTGQGYKIYIYHLQRLLQSIELHDENGLYRMDRFVWNSDKQVSKLLGQSTHAKDGLVLWAMTNEYAEDGNLRGSKIFSVATEHPESYITLDNTGLAFGEAESETPKFTYKGPFGAILEQNDGNGNLVEYQYKEGTALVTERLKKNKHEYKRRSFYKYDNATSALVQEIHDQGKSKKESDLYGVSDRTILEIQPRRYPKAGLDEEVLKQICYQTNTKREFLVFRLRLIFDTENNLVKKELYDTQDTLAKSEEYSYDDHGNCTRAVNTLGEVVLKSYDENDNCIRIEENSSGRITSIEYDLNNLPTSTTTAYLDGSVVKTASVYDCFGNKVASIDRYGNCTDYSFDVFSRLISITYPQVLNEHGATICPQEAFAYDIFNNIVTKTNPKGYIERYRYTSSGKLLCIDYPDGSNKHFEYSGDRVKDITNRDSTRTRYRYDQDQRLRGIETFAKDDCIFQQKFSYSYRNLCDKAQRPNGALVFRNHDHFGRVIQEIEPISRTLTTNDLEAFKTEYEYDSMHRPHRIKRWIDDKSFLVECYQYDQLDRIIERWIEEPDNTKSAHTISNYDAFGNLSETVTYGSRQTVEYLEGTRPHRIAHPDGKVTRIDYNEQQYNFLGQRFLEKIITDPTGMCTCATYDALGRHVQLVVKNPFGEILVSRQLFYDACNNLSVSLESKDPSTTIRTEWTYGPMQRLEMLREAVGTEDVRESRYSYNTFAQVTRISHSDGTYYTYEYGKDGTLTKLLNAQGEVISKVSFNLTGQFVGGESSDKIKTRRTYAPQGRILEESIDDAWGSYQCSYHYDRLGRMRLVNLPSKASIKYDYVGTRQKGIYYTSPRSMTPDYWHEFTKWNATGQPIEERLITGELKSRSYCEDGALSSLTTPYFSEAILKRDSVGNPVTIERENSIDEYSYNELNQLIEEKSEGKFESYSYDLLGNIKQHNDNTFYSNALNQLSSDKVPCRYDKQGNLIERGSISYKYNESNQLIEAKDTTSGKVAQYRYDVYGRRVSRKSDNSIHRYFYIGNTEIGAVDTYGTIFEIKIPERVGNNEAYGVVCLESKRKCYLPICDLFGNVVKLVDPASKKVVESYEYTGYGKETILKENSPQKDSIIDNPWRYRGLRTDPLTQLVQCTFRDYSPELQRFVTADPTGYADGPNLYGYARSNPIAYCDINGLATRRGACLCHGLDCEYYNTGKCGHCAGIEIEDDPAHRNFKVKEWFDYEQRLARNREHRNCKWPVNYSRSFDLQRETVPGKGLGFINGVMNSLSEAVDSATYVSNIAGGKNVQLTYAASNGLFPDLKQGSHNLYGYYATNATKILYDTWIEYFGSAGSDATYLQVCHSWGAIHVRNALMMCTDEIRKKIYVAAYCPGGYIDLELCKDVLHYINEELLRDGVPHFDQVGLEMALSQDTVIMVKSHPHEPFFNHAFQSPTYESSLYKSINKYFNSGKLR